ncbi:effector-associated domain EAD1-containing protein, partial [Nostoc sp.]
MLSDKQRRRLEQEKNSFEQSYELQTEKIARLRNAFVIETNPLSKFQYEQQIKDEETELRRLNDRLDEIEKQLQFAQSIPIISELKSIQKTNVSLSSQQRKELQLALIDAFPNTASLEQMLSFELDKNLRAIAGEGGLQDIVFKLIQTSIAQGWVEDLVRGACDYNPGNQQLKVIAQELLTKQQPEIISISSSNIPLSTKTKDDAIAKYRKKVEEFIADDGEISFVESEILKDLQETLELTEEQVRAVRDELLKPLGIYKKNLDKYRQVFTKLVDEKRYPLNEKDKVELKKLQEYYHLKEEDIALLFKEAEQQQIENFPQQEVQRLQRQRESEELIRIKHKYNLRELKDKLSELTSSLPTINITVLGTTGVGKTCYLFGLYSMMEAGAFTLISQDTDDHLNLIEG